MSIEFVEADATRMPFPDGSFDAVLALECGFHFQPSREAFFGEAARVLVRGGHFGACDILASARFYRIRNRLDRAQVRRGAGRGGAGVRAVIVASLEIRDVVCRVRATIAGCAPVESVACAAVMTCADVATTERRVGLFQQPVAESGKSNYGACD